MTSDIAPFLKPASTAWNAAYSDVFTGKTSAEMSAMGMSLYKKFDDETDAQGHKLGLQLVIYKNEDNSKFIVSFVGSNDAKDILNNMDLSFNQFYIKNKEGGYEPRPEIQGLINDAIKTTNPNTEITFAGHSAGGMLAQYAAHEFAKQLKASDTTRQLTLVTNNAPGVRDMMADRLKDGYDNSLSTQFKNIANTYERDDVVHSVGGRYFGDHAFEIQPKTAYEPVMAHYSSTSLNDISSGAAIVPVQFYPYHILPLKEQQEEPVAKYNQLDIKVEGLGSNLGMAYAIGSFIKKLGQATDENAPSAMQTLLSSSIKKTETYLDNAEGTEKPLAEKIRANSIKAALNIASSQPAILYYVGAGLQKASEFGNDISTYISPPKGDSVNLASLPNTQPPQQSAFINRYLLLYSTQSTTMRDENLPDELRAYYGHLETTGSTVQSYFLKVNATETTGTELPADSPEMLQRMTQPKRLPPVQKM